MTTPRSSKRDRLERAGYVHVSGWVHRDDAGAVHELIEVCREEVDQITEEAAPRGRPKKR